MGAQFLVSMLLDEHNDGITEIIYYGNYIFSFLSEIDEYSLTFMPFDENKDQIKENNENIGEINNNSMEEIEKKRG